MGILAVLPILTAALAGACALSTAARRFIWPVVALAAINVVLTPLTSGEWFYQRAEDASYELAVAKGDFTSLDSLLGQHDPQLVRRMIAMAVVLLISLVALAVLRRRSGRSGPGPGTASTLAAAAVLLAAGATLIQGYFLVM